MTPQLTPEELARIEAGVEAEEELDAETLTEIGALSEQLALHTIESEARHEQILEGVAENHECLLRLEQSQSQTENPVNQAMVTEIANLKTEVSELKGMIVALQASLAAVLTRPVSQSHSEPQNQPEPQPAPLNPEELSAEPSTREPAQAERKKHRIL